MVENLAENLSKTSSNAGFFEKILKLTNSEFKIPEIKQEFIDLDLQTQLVIILAIALNQKPKQSNLSLAVKEITTVILILSIISQFLIYGGV